jgi:tight adherence protein B
MVAACAFAGWILLAGDSSPRRNLRALELRAGTAAPHGTGEPAEESCGRGRWKALGRRRARAHPAEEFQRAAILVGQLASLLRAGRTPNQLWNQAYATRPPAERGREDLTARVLSAAASAAALGRPVATAVRGAAGADQPSPGTDDAATGVWLSVAACIETAEASGSPLADVFERLAAQLEADADAAAARTVALAGPRATAQVLSVLPLAGLGLGLLMGADPLGILVSTPLGALCLALGAALTVVGRWWSHRLVRAASEAR